MIFLIKHCFDILFYFSFLIKVRTAVSVGAIDGRLYAVGGECETKFSHEGTLYLNSVEYYDPIQNNWTHVAEMRCARSFAAVAVLNGTFDFIAIQTQTCTLSLLDSNLYS